MDSYEAANVVFSRIQNLEPENASKIMGYLLLQDYGEKEMIRLAFGPETLLQNLIFQAKTQLGIPSSTPSTPSSAFIHSSRPSPLCISSSRVPNNNGFDIASSSSPSWPLLSPNSTTSLSYASVVNGAGNINASSTPFQPTASLSKAFSYSNNNDNASDLVDEYELQDRFSFLNDSKSDDLFDPRGELAMSPTAYGDNGLHKRSFSVPGMCFGSEDSYSGFGWKPCLYFSRGFCKNGAGCRFVHGDSADSAAAAGSPSELNEFEQCQEILRSKAAAQQRKIAAASQFMAGATFLPQNKCMNFLNRQQNDSQRLAAALMMGDEIHKFGRIRPERSDFSQMGLGGAMSPSARQIYLTFPADSTFREEDVSSYFSFYGPVQDVRIPYQQKRMFGFVTFVFAETVKLILAKGNPHFVCDSRVLVKPYKEKGKIPDKRQQQQQQLIEREEYTACPSPSRINCRESFDLHLGGGRMFYNNQEMLRRKLEEEADLQQAIELQGRRLLNLQLLDLKNHRQHRHFHDWSTGSPLPSPTIVHSPNNQTPFFPIDGIDKEVNHENGSNPDDAAPQNADQEVNPARNHKNGADQEVSPARNHKDDADQEVSPACNHSDGDDNNRDNEEKSNNDESDLHENSLEHILPDNLFGSPKKSAGDHLTVFSTASVEVDENTTSPTASSPNSNPLVHTTSLNMTSLKSCFLQMPRFSSGHGTIGL
ncbi:RNA-BINDING (RRM/RBD/RNP MOTIFS) [Salix purpurea]|uniref:RNA-BINDING (RRM/RBD/RNP MOTIFS) n=1 Tax=Salix purpurea TaxID=77065 RepID=A0A9Q0SWK2_SALPP|nr:RNA-BINDING (RRM/RBD/RNP MOTIFS) [Salix purpurea]